MKMPYYNKRGDFNGATCDWDVARVVHYSKTINPPQVIRMPDGQGFKYYWKGYEVQMDEIFQAGTAVKVKGTKPKAKPVIEVTRKGKNGRPAAVFTWGESKTGKPIEWMPRNGFSDYVCKETGEHIARRTMSYSARTGDDLIRSTWRLSHIPDDAVML